MRRAAVLLWLASTAAPLIAQNPSTVPPPAAAPAASAAASAAAPSGYRIGPKDLLEVRVFEEPQLNVQRRVAEDGTISLPLIGDFSVSELTAPQVTTKLKALLEKCCLTRASVEVQVREFLSKPISVLGAVKQPGPLAFSGRWTLLEAIAAAGGLAEGHGNEIYVLRRSDNGLSDQIAIGVDDLITKADPAANIPIFANDVINVPATVNVTIYMLGEVAHPGAVVFQSNERITVLAAVARAGGLSDRASNHLLIKRRSRTGPEQEIRVDYRAIVSGKAPDLGLEEGDVIVVKESFF
jgi:polysaccharide export outer membrane protein